MSNSSNRTILLTVLLLLIFVQLDNFFTVTILQTKPGSLSEFLRTVTVRHYTHEMRFQTPIQWCQSTNGYKRQNE